MATVDYDVVVVGGGPGGSTTATLTALDGHRVLLLEKETFPRYQIGESLLPSTIHGIFPLLGVSEEVEKAGFTRKRGGTFRWGASPNPWTFAFSSSPRLAEFGSFAYQVERTKFDQMLLDNAVRVGVEVHQGARVSAVLRDGERVAGVRYTDVGGVEREATATYVVDASGNGSRLHNEVGGSRDYSEFFLNVAAFGYFEGGGRLPEPNSGNILSAAFDRGWFWYIPLTDQLTSVGAVVRREEAASIQGDPEAALLSLIDECPIVRDLLGDAKRCQREPYDKVRVRRDYSYDREKMWCPGMVLVGDAACFIDPVFSSGVHLATYSAVQAARSINSVLAGVADESRCFEEFQTRYHHEFALFRDFLISFYKMNVVEDSYFWEAKKVIDHDGTALEAFVELVGGVASEIDFSRTGYPEEAAPTPVPVEVFDALAIGMQSGIKEMRGDASARLEKPASGALIASSNGRRWEIAP
ncbi:tryptophan 7-halogenase [Actinomycetota bacterium Odt1-20B]